MSRIRSWFRGHRVAVRIVVGVVVACGLVTGFGLSAALAADYHGTITAGGSSVGVTLSSSGDTGYLTFTGSAGERVFVKAATGSLAGFGAYTVTLLDPSSAQVGSTGLLFGGHTGFIDTQTLSAGTYTVKITPVSDTTGTTTVTLYDVAADVSGSITPGGSSVSVTNAVGQNGRLTFSGTAGQRVFLKVSTSSYVATSTASSVVNLLKPDGSTLAGTGAVTAVGFGWIDTTTLPTSGTYAIAVDPQDDTTGTTTLTLYDVAADASGSVTPGGSSVSVTNTVGQNGDWTFSGTAGQRVFVKASAGTLAGDGTHAVYARLLKPDGSQLAQASVGANLTSFIDTQTLPTTGTYTLVADPYLDVTGTTTLTLYSVPADVTTPIAIDGPAVTLSLSVGQDAALPFTGAAGQAIRFDRSQISIPTAQYAILKPDGSTLTSTVAGSSNGNLTATLPTTGTYTLSVAHYQDGSGAATVDLVIQGDAPFDGASMTVCGAAPVFRAEPVSGSSQQYQFQVASDSGFSTVVSDSGSLPATNTYMPPAGTLTNGSTYYWRWKTASGSWSAGKSFSIDRSHLGSDGSPLWSDGPLSVNEVTGNLLVSLPGPSYPSEVGALAATVSYNSLDSSDRGLGAGWLLDAGASVAEAPVKLIDHNLLTGAGHVDAVEALFSDGSSGCFAHVGQTNSYIASPGDGDLLSKNADGSWTYTSGDTLASYGVADGSTGQAQLTSVEVDSANPGKGTLTYTFSSQDPTKITSVSDDTGRSLSFTWNSLNSSGCSTAIVCITGPDSVTWKLVGDGSGGTSGRLAKINDGTRDIAAVSYDGSGRVNKLQNADDLDPTHASTGYDSTHALTVSYDSSGRAASVSDGPVSDQTPSTATASFAYSPGAVSTTATRATHGSLSSGTIRTAAGSTTITPPNQQGASSPKTATIFYDADGNVIEQDDPLGNVTEVGYNSRDEQIWSEDPAGNPTDNSWDTVNDVLTSTTGPDPGSGRPVTSYRYDETQIGTSSTAGAALQGLVGSYYPNINLAGRPTLHQTDSTVDFTWGTTGPSGLGTGSNYSVRWTGDLNVTTAGSYTFSTVASDGTRLTIDGIVAVDNWIDQSASTVSSQAISLSAGLHKLVLEYYDHTDSSQVHLHWACTACSPAISDQVIPSSALEPAWLDQTSVVSPSGRIAFTHYAHPETGLPDYSLVKLGDGTKLITSYSYDAYGRISQKVMPKGNASATINSNGDLSGTPDSDYITSWTYYGPTDTAAPPSACGGGSAVNQAGQLKTKSLAGLADQTLVYDSAGRPIALTKGTGTTCSSYDSEGRLTSTEAPGDSQATTFTYDPAGLTLTATDATGTISSSYDEADRLKDSIDSFGAETSYAYDGDGNITTRTAAAGALSSSTNYATSYSYDAADQMTGLTDPASNAYSFFYDSRGNLKATQYPNGTFSWNDINPLGELTALYNRHGTLSTPLPSSVPADSSSSPLADYAYTYNTDGQKTQETMSGGGLTTATNQYAYDNLGRLNQVTLPDGTCRKYSYDLDSNRTQLQQSATGCSGTFTTTASYTYDPTTTAGIDELTSQTGPTRSFSYDSDGRTTARGSDTISWDGWDRTTGGTFGGTTVTYTYDAAGNLRTRAAGSTTRYLYGGTHTPLFETNSSGTITLTYIQGPAGDLAHYAGPPASGSTITYLDDNGHGDLAATADNTGSRTNTYTYQAFGTPIETVPSNTTTQRWTGAYDKQLDTTSNLIQMGARPYDPTLGRFLATDPIEGGSLNTYIYAGNDPLNMSDPSGLIECVAYHHANFIGGAGQAVFATTVVAVSDVFCTPASATVRQKFSVQAEVLGRWTTIAEPQRGGPGSDPLIFDCPAGEILRLRTVYIAHTRRKGVRDRFDTPVFCP